MPHDHYGKRILRLWEARWRTLTADEAERFLEHPSLSRIKTYQEVRVDMALKKHRKLDDVLTELERPMDQQALADEIQRRRRRD